MVPLWRVSRNRYARAAYDALKAAGVTGTRMDEYQVHLRESPGDNSPPTPKGLRVDVFPAAAAGERDVDPNAAPRATPLADEWAAVARADGRTVGRALVSVGRRPYVEALERRVAFPGAYVRRVFVDPSYRGRGAATALLHAALAVARTELDAEAASALVAADNRPSQRLFERCGFSRARTHEYVRLGPLSRYQVRPR